MSLDPAKRDINFMRSYLQKIQQKNKTKSVGMGLDVLEGRKNVLDINILVCVDVSGSISAAQFSEFMHQVDAIRGLSRVKVIEIDTEIVAMYDYFKIQTARILRLGGGGGTEFTPAFRMAKNLEPDAILFMTDGCVSGRVPDPGIPTGWVLTRGGQKPYSFGTVVREL